MSSGRTATVLGRSFFRAGAGGADFGTLGAAGFGGGAGGRGIAAFGVGGFGAGGAAGGCGFGAAARAASGVGAAPGKPPPGPGAAEPGRNPFAMVWSNAPVSGGGVSGGGLAGGRCGPLVEVSPPAGLPGALGCPEAPGCFCAPGCFGAEPARPGGRNSIVFIGAASAGGADGGGVPGGAPPGRPGDRNSIVFIGTSAGGTSGGCTAAGGIAPGGPESPRGPGPPTIVLSMTSGGTAGRSSVLSAASRTNSVLPTRIRAPGGSVVFSPALMTLSSTRVGLVAPSPSSTTNPEVTPIRNCLRPTSSSLTVKSTLRDRPTIMGSPIGTYLGARPGSRTSS
ncbi:MAG: hypothetical protein ACI9SE_003704 [Neolewinella sp.]|jgi:hypothetical protein